ncbi:MAG: hypothetical protein M1114_05870 [Candidatus Dependentiae bacterium]|nr:hypothetical protein [Candidatus Dependentiae bacterium]
MNIRFLLLFIFLFTTFIQAKVLIFTYAYNRPEFIEYQHLTFKKFMLDEYEFVVFNDARDHEMANKIENMCKKYDLSCIRIPQEIHNRPYLQRWPGEDYNHPTIRNVNVVQYSLNEYGFDHPGIVALLDSDMFLIKEFSFEEYMKEHQLAGLPQSKSHAGKQVEYLWIGLVFLDMPNLPDNRTLDFNCGRVGEVPVDAGGQTYHYITNHPQIAVQRMNVSYIPDKSHYNESCWFARQLFDLGYKEIQAEFLLNSTFFHYRGGSNWDLQPANFHVKKWSTVKHIMDRLLTE